MKTPTFTPEQYAESAEMLGHSCGPFEFNGYRYVRNAAGNNVCQLGDVGATVTSEQENAANGKLFEEAPSVRIHRDSLLAENERLREACEVALTVQECTNPDDGMYASKESRIRALKKLRAALTGTSPSRAGELEKACRRAIMALEANGAPNCEAVKECKAALAGGAH